jgi:hypothetical protein
MGTSPLLVGDDAARAWTAIDEIAAALAAMPREALADDPTLSGGSAGMALFFAYLAGVKDDRGHEDHAARLLEWAQESVAEGHLPAGAGLYQGFTGVAWVAEHVTGEPQDAIDEPLAGYLAHAPWRGDYDLIAGLAGHAVWALDALPRAGAVECLRLACTRLVELAQTLPDGGVRWWTPPMLLPPHQLEIFPRGYENFGCGHGYPAVLAVLAQAIASGALDDALAVRARAAVDGGMQRLLGFAARAEAAGRVSRFPSLLEDGATPDDARLAWCYGDAGVIGALGVVAEVLGATAWTDAIAAMALAAARRDVRTAGIRDAGLCHGAAGLGVLFQRFHSRHGGDELAAAATHWYRAALEQRRPADEFFAGVWGYTVEGPRATHAWLTGATGVAMALLAAVTGSAPEWDRLLLASPSPNALHTP